MSPLHPVSLGEGPQGSASRKCIRTRQWPFRELEGRFGAGTGLGEVPSAPLLSAESRGSDSVGSNPWDQDKKLGRPWALPTLAEGFTDAVGRLAVWSRGSPLTAGTFCLRRGWR